MCLSNTRPILLFLISFIFYGCSPLSQSLEQHNAETTRIAITTASSLSEGEKKDLFLIKSVDTQIYYITNLSGVSTIPLNIPSNIRGLAMSPNGQTIAYITNENPILYLFNIKNQTSSALTDSIDFQPGIGLAWSPDSQSIVFSCRLQNTLGLSLCLVNITNSENIQVLVKSEILGASDMLDGATSPSWDSDRQRIVFLSSSTSPSSLGGKIISTKDIWLFDFSTNSTKLVFPNNTEGISYIFTPVLLSEDNSILFSGREGNFNTLFDYKIDSHKTQNIMFTDNSFDLVDFVLSPDRKSFLVHVPTLENSIQNFIPTLYSIDGHLLKQLNSLTNFQVISWSIQE